MQLKESKSDKTVVAFLIFPTKTNSFNVESLRGHAVAKGLKDTIDEIQKEIGVRLYETCLRGHVPDPHDLLSKNDLVKLKRCIFAQGASNLPPITTHNIVEDLNDPVMNAFRRCQLFNNHHDRVKVLQYFRLGTRNVPSYFNTCLLWCYQCYQKLRRTEDNCP